MSTNDTLREALETLRAALDPDDWIGEVTMHAFIDAALAEPVSGGAERDEQADFNAWLNEVVSTKYYGASLIKLQRHDDMTGSDEKIAWAAWQARAALNGGGVAGPGDSSDAFYAGLYLKSSPMWHRLHNLAVSKGYDHVQYAIECAPVYKCDCMGARKMALDLEGRTVPCECVAGANDPLAADVAQGGEVEQINLALALEAEQLRADLDESDGGRWKLRDQLATQTARAEDAEQECERLKATQPLIDAPYISYAMGHWWACTAGQLAAHKDRGYPIVGLSTLVDAQPVAADVVQVPRRLLEDAHDWLREYASPNTRSYRVAAELRALLATRQEGSKV